MAKTKKKPEKRNFKSRNTPNSSKSVRAAKFRPKNWEEVETQGVAKTHVFEKTKSKSTKKYPPPNTHPTYVARWNEFLPDIIERQNFKVGHLNLLDVLCRMFVELDVLSEIIRTEGYTYFAEGGRNGPQLKSRPEVQQINRTRSEIRSLSKSLGISLARDTEYGDGGAGSEEPEDEWS